MIRIWARMAGMTAVLALALGCRTPAPNVKPLPSPEVLTAPPQEARYNSGGYPKQAFQQDNFLKKKILEGDNQIMPARGGGMGPGMGPGAVR